MSNQTTEQINSIQNEQNHGVTEWSHNIIESYSNMNKFTNQAKKSFTLLVDYINKNNVKLSDDNNNNINLLIGVWNNQDKFNLDDFISIVERCTNEIKSNTDDLNNDEYLSKLWHIYEAFALKSLDLSKQIENIYKEYKDKVNV